VLQREGARLEAQPVGSAHWVPCLLRCRCPSHAAVSSVHCASMCGAEMILPVRRCLFPFSSTRARPPPRACHRPRLPLSLRPSSPLAVPVLRTPCKPHSHTEAARVVGVEAHHGVAAAAGAGGARRVGLGGGLLRCPPARDREGRGELSFSPGSAAPSRCACPCSLHRPKAHTQPALTARHWSCARQAARGSAAGRPRQTR
jgi:hypothetical protein